MRNILYNIFSDYSVQNKSLKFDAEHKTYRTWL